MTHVALEPNLPVASFLPDGHIRHRLSRGGNRRLNHVLHMAAIAQIRLDTEGRTYYRRKLTEAKTRKEARRCLKRRLSDIVYRQLVADAQLTEHDAADADEHDPESAPEHPPQARLPSPRVGAPEPSRCGAPPDERP